MAHEDMLKPEIRIHPHVTGVNNSTFLTLMKTEQTSPLSVKTHFHIRELGSKTQPEASTLLARRNVLPTISYRIEGNLAHYGDTEHSKSRGRAKSGNGTKRYKLLYVK